MELRKPNSDELRLLSFLIENAESADISEFDVEGLNVKPMEDGGMGGLRLFPPFVNDIEDARAFGKAVSECCFDDQDGVKVIATLYVDKADNLFELDIWKTNNAKLIKIPDSFSRDCSSDK